MFVCHTDYAQIFLYFVLTGVFEVFVATFCQEVVEPVGEVEHSKQQRKYKSKQYWKDCLGLLLQKGLSEVFRINKKESIILPQDNITCMIIPDDNIWDVPHFLLLSTW